LKPQDQFADTWGFVFEGPSSVDPDIRH